MTGTQKEVRGNVKHKKRMRKGGNRGLLQFQQTILLAFVIRATCSAPTRYSRILIRAMKGAPPGSKVQYMM